MCTCALVSSAISAAFSPPHMPARSLGGLSPVESHGPNANVAAANANAAFVSMGPPTSLPSAPCLWSHGALTAGNHDRKPLVLALQQQQETVDEHDRARHLEGFFDRVEDAVHQVESDLGRELHGLETLGAQHLEPDGSRQIRRRGYTKPPPDTLGEPPPHAHKCRREQQHPRPVDNHPREVQETAEVEMLPDRLDETLVHLEELVE